MRRFLWIFVLIGLVAGAAGIAVAYIDPFSGDDPPATTTTTTTEPPLDTTTAAAAATTTVTTTTTTTTTTTAPPSQKSTSWDAAPCPDANGSLSFWLEVSIPVDANHPSHVISDPPNCADTTVETSATTGAGSYRVDFFLTGGAGATGGTDAVAMTVFWT